MFEVGVDCVNVNRFDAKMPYIRIFTDSEIEYCQSKKRPSEHFAARFAAKEATIKALSSVISKLKLTDIQILNDSFGKPFVKLNTNHPVNLKIKVSLSHTSELAIASVIAYVGEK
tara:strand:+ start:406 stop:750 length:345 start_codon:yes stop_codon:yes gene_type:complete